MSSQKLFPNGEAPEGSIGRHGNQWTNGIFMALSGMAAMVGFVAMMFMMREIALIRGQQMAFMKQQEACMRKQGRDHDQMVLLRSQLQGLKQELEAKVKFRVFISGTFWKSSEVHHRTKRESMANTVLVHSKLGGLGCLSGRDGRDGPQRPPGPPGEPGQCSSPESSVPASFKADCAAYHDSGQTTSGVYTLSSPSYAKAYCDMDTTGGGWTVIQRRQDGSVPFNRTWEEYKQGFGDKNGEYWLGNENIHLLTQQKNYKLRIDMSDWQGHSRYAEYSTFRLVLLFIVAILDTLTTPMATDTLQFT
ncbi:ANGPT2 [Branchiostoma lanceolatum]|uniref:ANGPT2 protein n=1 Tax=Branchiostoma lanceolatum TaxID=7740 RepID=A0A8J9WBK5_BRALA|nr:ANGPT2 [Branchiostoma lanceolatum]